MRTSYKGIREYSGSTVHLKYVNRTCHERCVSPCVLQDTFGRRVELTLWDTAGQEEYAGLRPISYSESHVILVCFAVDGLASFHNIQDTWIPEIMHCCQDVSFILVATKTDLRDDPETVRQLSEEGKKPVSLAQGLNLARTINATAYMECSSLTGKGVMDVFRTAASVALMQKKKKPLLQRTDRCVIF